MLFNVFIHYLSGPLTGPRMNKITFSLKDPKADKDTAIILRYSASDGRLKYYTGESGHPDKWKTQRGTRAVLSRITACLEELDIDYRTKGELLTMAVIRDALDNLLNRKEKGGDLFSYLPEIYNDIDSGKILTPKNRRYSDKTIRSIKNAERVLKEFRPNMKFSDVTLDLYNKFISYATIKDFSINYIGSIIKNWKTLMRLTAKYHKNTEYKHPDFRKISEENNEIYLNDYELATIAALKLDPKLSIARDWLLLGCYLGLRISDLGQLSPRNLSDGFIIIANEKTDYRVKIPIHPVAARILKKGFPAPISDTDFNEQIKKVARIAKIKDRVLYSITKGGVRKDEYLEKWQMVSSHTLRRSLITNLRKARVPDSIIMKLAGMRSISTLRRYDRLTPEEAGEIAAGLDYFK